MAKSSFVLQTLSLLTLESMLQLCRVLQVHGPLKKVAGEELIVWDDAPELKESKPNEDNVVQFPKRTLQSLICTDEGPMPPLPEVPENASMTDLIFWQRELAREAVNVPKKDAVKGYQKSTQMYVVKSSEEGKEKIRFASTNGVLVNKKQA